MGSLIRSFLISCYRLSLAEQMGEGAIGPERREQRAEWGEKVSKELSSSFFCVLAPSSSLARLPSLLASCFATRRRPSLRPSVAVCGGVRSHSSHAFLFAPPGPPRPIQQQLFFPWDSKARDRQATPTHPSREFPLTGPPFA